MKVNLVVASGVHEGRMIPITGPQFLIGRDAQCNLRPASQAISKLHCGVLVRDGKVYIKDFGSTNGTLVNDVLVQGAEVAVADGTSIRVGPLDFRVRIEAVAASCHRNPLPADTPEAAAALAAVKAAAAAVAATPKAPTRDTTPSPGKAAAAAKPGTKPAPAVKPTDKPITPTKPGSKETPALKTDAQETPSVTSSESVTDDDHDRIAAMLLGMDEDGNGSVPDGSTVMEIPSPLAAGGTPAAKPDDKDKKKGQSPEEMSNTANDLLRQYMRRPK